MPKTFFGRLSIGILKLTPVSHAIRDHQNAFDIVRRSEMQWTLTGCPYIKDGPTKGIYRTSEIFPGGFKVIHPGDVADAILNQIGKENIGKIIGIWY